MVKEEHDLPDFWVSVLRWFCPPDLCEGIEGDLAEQFDDDRRTLGLKKARWRLGWRVLRFFRPGIVLRNRFSFGMPGSIMFSNYLTVAIRNIQRRKLYSFINAFGLSIALGFCLLIYLYIEDERSFDQFHDNKERIYRVEETTYQYWRPEGEDRYFSTAYIQTGMKAALKDEIPAVEYATRFNSGRLNVRTGNGVYTEDITYVDADFFRMFSFRLLSGNIERIFQGKFETVITPAIAQKYFGDKNPLGEVLVIGAETEVAYTITGIVETPPANSSLDFKILIPQENRRSYDQILNQWSSISTPTFVQLAEGTDVNSLPALMDRLMDKHMKQTLEEWNKESPIPEGTKLFEVKFTPMSAWHFKTGIPWHKVSDPQYSYILAGISGLILLITCINYISLALMNSAARRKEVGIRKVSGAGRRQLAIQFSFESVVLVALSMALGLVLVVLLLPYFNEFTSKDISFANINILSFVGVAALLALCVGVLSGSYPALFLSRFNPATVLKGSSTGKIRATFTRPLVVVQFSFSAFLIISSVIMYRQMQFITEKDLGFDKDHVLVLPTQRGRTSQSGKIVEQLRTRLASKHDVISVAGTSLSFGHGTARQGYTIDGENKLAYVYTVDPHYVSALGLEIIWGRNFDPTIAGDTNSVIVNEALVKDMKWSSLENTFLNWQGDKEGPGAKVIGVVKNYHYQSLVAPIAPAFLYMEANSAALNNILIKIRPGNIEETVMAIEGAWKNLFPDQPFNYSFLDEDLARQYQAQGRWMIIMVLSTFFAILISCMGLFGLSGIHAANRTREIGIRKVLGADLSTIFFLINGQYVVLSVFAFGFAVPFSWYAMDKWLADFEFRISIGWQVFAIGMLVALSTAILTVTYHGIRAALGNPAETLKYE